MPQRQFSLSHLLVEISLIAIGLGLLRWSVLFVHDSEWPRELLTVAALPAALACFGAAVGGLFGRMGVGAAGALALFILWVVFLAPGIE